MLQFPSHRFATSCCPSPTFHPENYPENPKEGDLMNPNGTRKMQDAGSARRNRLRLHAFGSPGFWPMTRHLFAETAKNDSRRRRVGKDAEISSPQYFSVVRRTNTGPSTSAPNVMDTTKNWSPQSKVQVNGIGISTPRPNRRPPLLSLLPFNKLAARTISLPQFLARLCR